MALGQSAGSYPLSAFTEEELANCPLIGGMKAATGANKVGYYFNLAAGPLSKGGVCPTAHKSEICKLLCYARSGMFTFRVVQRALARNYYCTLRPDFVDRMVANILFCCEREKRKNQDIAYIRIHSSGEFFAPWYVQKWQEVVAKLKEADKATKIALWAPTRMYFGPVLQELIKLQAMSCDDVTVAIRPSAINVNDDAPIIVGLAAGSSVRSDGKGCCPAVKNGLENRKNSYIDRGKGKTDKHGLPHDCRSLGCHKCWTALDHDVSYDIHGYGVCKPMK